MFIWQVDLKKSTTWIFSQQLQHPLSFKFHQDLPPGIATSSVGAATNIGTSIVEKLLNSKQIKDLNAAFERDKMLTTKFERQIEEVTKNFLYPS